MNADAFVRAAAHLRDAWTSMERARSLIEDLKLGQRDALIDETISIRGELQRLEGALEWRVRDAS